MIQVYWADEKDYIIGYKDLKESDPIFWSKLNECVKEALLMKEVKIVKLRRFDRK